MSMIWDLFGVEANSNVPDADGNVWTVRSSDGWDAPDQRTQLMSPTGQHGQSILNPYAEGRAVVIKGLVLAPSDTAAWKAYDRITASMPGLGGSGDIVAYEPTPKALTVGQAGPPRVSKPLGGTISYQLTLLAEYPFKRAVTPTTVTVAAGMSETFTVGGTFAAEVEVELLTSGTVVLTRSGVTLSTGVLPAGSVLSSIDRTIVDDAGADAYSLIAAGSQWPALAPGSNTLTNAGTANLSVTFHDTYA